MIEPKMFSCLVGVATGWVFTGLSCFLKYAVAPVRHPRLHWPFSFLPISYLSWFVEHATSIAAVFAVLASIFTMLAAFEKWRWYRHKRKH